MGKAQSLDSLLLTPTGFKPLHELVVGDEVIGSNGLPTKIVQLHPVAKLETYWVIFKDGAIITCTADHLWTTRRHSKFTTRNTVEVMGFLKDEPRYTPAVSPVVFPKRELPLHPYILGVLLGDGCLRQGTPAISYGDPEIRTLVSEALPQEVYIGGNTGRVCFLSTPKGKPNPITDALKHLGLVNCGSYEKFIPINYMLTSIEDRFALLQGLMDTDGTVNKNTNGSRGLSFCSVSPQLATQTQALIHSLGGVCMLKWRKTYAYKADGTRKAGKNAAILTFRLPSILGVPFRLTAKTATFLASTSGRKKPPSRRIVSIQKTGLTEDCRCITVEASDGLYVTDGYVLTHNSMLGMNLAIAGALGMEEFLGHPLHGPFRTLLLQSEIHQRGVYERFAQMIGASGATPTQLQNIYINEDRTNRLSDDATFLLFREEVRKIVPDLVILDPLAHVLTTSENDNAIVGAVLEKLATIRDDPGCAIMVIHHDAKVSEATAMRAPQQRARGADRLNADPDCILSLVPGPRLASGPTGKMHIASRYGRSVAPFSIMLNEDRLWFEQFVDRGDPIQIVKWIAEHPLPLIEEDRLIAIVEAGWALKDERQHRAARRYIARAEAEGFIVEEDVAGVKHFKLSEKET